MTYTINILLKLSDAMDLSAASSQGPITVLVVDDDDIDAMMIERSIKAHSSVLKMRRAVDGLEALEILKQGELTSDLEPYLMLLDINMPRMNGIELLQAIRDNDELHRAVIFMLTTSTSDEDQLAAYSQNIAGYISKSDIGPGYEALVQLLTIYQQLVRLPHS